MNLKTTPLLFGLMLGILWLFGLVLVYKKGAVDDNLIVTGMQGNDVKVDSIAIHYAGDKDKPESELFFQRENDRWYLQQNGAKVKVEGFKIDDIVRQVKDAKRYEEERVQDDLRHYGLPPEGTPRMVVTLKGKKKDAEKTWTLNVGNTGAGEFTVYVNSSDRPGRAFPVQRAQLDALFFKDTADLRPKRLFDVVEPTVTSVLATDGATKLELKKAENSWRYVEPPLGFAGFESTGPTDDKLKEKEGGVKGLINAITALRVESDNDFMPPGARSLADYGLDPGKETMRLALGSGADKKDEEKAAKEDNREVLLIGKPAKREAGSKGGEQYYARMLNDEGVFRVNASMLEPIKEDVRDPKRIRSHDVVVYDAKKVDAVILSIARTAKDDKGKETVKNEEVKLLHPADKDWQVDSAGDKSRKGNEKAIQAFIETLHGKKDIKEFADNKDASWGGLNGPNTSDVSVFIDALEKEKDKKKDEKKDEKRQAKKDEKQEAKETVPTFKKDVKPVVKLVIGNVDKEQKIAYVKRVLQDGTESRFTVPYAYVEKLHLENGGLAFVDTALPSQSPGEVVALDIQRGKEKVEVDRNGDRWTLRDVHDPLGGKLADRDKVAFLVKGLTSMTATRWVRKDDAEKLGLKNPDLVVTLFTKNEERLTASGAGSLVAAAVSPGMLPVVGVVLANRQSDRGDRVTITFGKEIEQDKQKLVYVQHSGTDLVALVPVELAKQWRDADLRDRSAVAQTQARVGATLAGLGGEATGSLLPSTPLGTGVVNRFDAGKVKEVTIALRTKVELRSFTFKRIGKEKTWEEVSGVKEFQVDTDRLMQMLEQICRLKTNRFASFGGPTGDSKLTVKEAMLRIELTFEDGNTVTLLVGAPYSTLGYFAHSSAWPDAVFFVPTSMIDPWLRGAESFGKARATAGL